MGSWSPSDVARDMLSAGLCDFSEPNFYKRLAEFRLKRSKQSRSENVWSLVLRLKRFFKKYKNDISLAFKMMCDEIENSPSANTLNSVDDHPLANKHVWTDNSIPDVASFDMSPHDWQLMTKYIVNRSTKYSNWPDLIRKGIKESNPYCSFGFKRHYFNNGPSHIHFVCVGHCTFDNCCCQVKVRCFRARPGHFVVCFTGAISHTGTKSVRLSGIRRSHYKEKLRESKPRAVALECLGNLPDDVFESGNRDDAPSRSVLKKVRQEAIKISVPDQGNEWLSLMSLRRSQLANHSCKGKVIGTLQVTIFDPPGLMMWSEETLSIYRKLSAVDVVYVDATGSIIKDPQKTYYLYEIVMRHPVKGKSPLAVGSFLSSSHDISSITYFFHRFRKHEKLLFGPKNVAKLFICDGSMAIITSILLGFMNEDVDTYFIRCYAVVTGCATEKDFSKPFVRLCASHTMKNFKALCSKNMARFEELMYIFGALVITDNWRSIQTILYHLVIILLTKNERLASDSYNVLRLTFDLSLPSFGSDIVCSDDFTHASDNEPSSSRNPFCRALDVVIAEAQNQAESASTNGTNKFRNFDIFQSFKKYYVPKIPLFTGLMTGNLSRFGASTSYVNYGNFFRRLEKSTFRNLSRSTRTQGNIEKSFQELKRTRLGNRRFGRLDEFVVMYDALHKPLIREFQDGMQSASKKKTKIQPKSGFSNNKPDCDEEEIWRKRHRHKLPDTSIGKYFQSPVKRLRHVSNNESPGECTKFKYAKHGWIDNIIILFSVNYEPATDKYCESQVTNESPSGECTLVSVQNAKPAIFRFKTQRLPPVNCELSKNVLGFRSGRVEDGIRPCSMLPQNVLLIRSRSDSKGKLIKHNKVSMKMLRCTSIWSFIQDFMSIYVYL